MSQSRRSRPTRWVARWVVGIGGAALAITGFLASGACSFVVDTETEQCSTTADCAAKGPAFVNTICADHVCTPINPAACKRTEDCLSKGAAFANNVCGDAGLCVFQNAAACGTTSDCVAKGGSFAKDICNAQHLCVPECSVTPDCAARGPEFADLICDNAVCVKECASTTDCARRFGAGGTKSVCGTRGFCVECVATKDCTDRGAEFANDTCNADGACVKKAGCFSDKECIDANGGAPFACRTKTAGEPAVCVPLQKTLGDGGAPNCKPYAEETGEIGNPDTIWLGAVHDLTGRLGTTAGVPQMNMLDLARSEISTLASGLPPLSPGQPRRHIAFIGCDDVGGTLTEPALNYLIDDLKVPVVFGFTTSGLVLSLSPKITIPKGVLLMSAGVGTPLFPTLGAGIPAGSPRLNWRTEQNSDALSAEHGQIVGDLIEPELRQSGVVGDAGSPTVRVALVHSANANPQGIADFSFGALKFNGKTPTDNGSDFVRLNYGDPALASHTDAEYLSAASSILSFKPHIVILIGQGELPKVMDPVEQGWAALGLPYKPQYVIANASVTAVTAYLAANPDVGDNQDLRHRIRSISADFTSPVSQSAISKYASKYPTGANLIAPNFICDAYDAFYLTAYAIVAAGAQPLTGTTIASNLFKLFPGAPDAGAPGPRIDVGPEGVASAFALLAQGLPIDFNGASGPQDFDPTRGDAVGDTRVVCIRAVGGVASGPYLTGAGYKASGPTAGTLTGTYACEN